MANGAPALVAALASSGCWLAETDPPPYLVHDGFETTTLASDWAPNIASACTIAPDTTMAYRGVGALHVHLDAVANNEPQCRIE